MGQNACSSDSSDVCLLWYRRRGDRGVLLQFSAGHREQGLLSDRFGGDNDHYSQLLADVALYVDAPMASFDRAHIQGRVAAAGGMKAFNSAEGKGGEKGKRIGAERIVNLSFEIVRTQL